MQTVVIEISRVISGALTKAQEFACMRANSLGKSTSLNWLEQEELTLSRAIQILWYPVVLYTWSFRTQSFQSIPTQFESIRTQTAGRSVPAPIYINSHSFARVGYDNIIIDRFDQF